MSLAVSRDDLLQRLTDVAADYKVGRMYEPVYLCFRWEDNTKAQLSNEQEVRYAE